MAKDIADLDFSEAVDYHYGEFPPQEIDYQRLIPSLANASSALARYDQMLKGMHNSEILLTPMRNQEAVISSRMEGTVSTLDEVMQYEADQLASEKSPTGYRTEALEVLLYARSMKITQQQMEEGHPISQHLLRSAHKILLGFGRGALLSPGEFKIDQNYLADRSKRKILFVPISPEQLGPGMDNLIAFIGDDRWQILFRTALAHLEFEALHPFKDGNGRVGRMLITLMLWRFGVVSAPHFYVSNYFETNRDEYIDRMREVSRSGQWTEWIEFFLNGLETQANENLEKAEKIRELYEEMKEVFRVELSSQWSTAALDFVFSSPVFRNNVFTQRSGIPAPTAHRFTRTLQEQGLLTTLVPAAGRRPAMYAFEPLLALVRE